MDKELLETFKQLAFQLHLLKADNLGLHVALQVLAEDVSPACAGKAERRRALAVEVAWQDYLKIAAENPVSSFESVQKLIAFV